jgi:putative FmdB family regulatory protein
MPMYEFVCPQCGQRFERLAGAGTRREECPHCGAADAERVLSPVAPPARLAKSPGTARKMEDKRGVDRGGAMERFRKQRARERKRAGS